MAKCTLSARTAGLGEIAPAICTGLEANTPTFIDLGSWRVYATPDQQESTGFQGTTTRGDIWGELADAAEQAREPAPRQASNAQPAAQPANVQQEPVANAYIRLTSSAPMLPTGQTSYEWYLTSAESPLLNRPERPLMELLMQKYPTLSTEQLFYLAGVLHTASDHTSAEVQEDFVARLSNLGMVPLEETLGADSKTILKNAGDRCMGSQVKTGNYASTLRRLYQLANPPETTNQNQNVRVLSDQEFLDRLRRASQ